MDLNTVPSRFLHQFGAMHETAHDVQPSMYIQDLGFPWIENKRDEVRVQA